MSPGISRVRSSCSWTSRRSRASHARAWLTAYAFSAGAVAPGTRRPELIPPTGRSALERILEPTVVPGLRYAEAERERYTEWVKREVSPERVAKWIEGNVARARAPACQDTPSP
jgi:hypothetical protein